MHLSVLIALFYGSCKCFINLCVLLVLPIKFYRIVSYRKLELVKNSEWNVSFREHRKVFLRRRLSRQSEALNTSSTFHSALFSAPVISGSLRQEPVEVLCISLLSGTAASSIRWVAFHKVVWRHYSDEGGEFPIFWCEISSVCTPKLLKSVHFCRFIQNIKGTFFWETLVIVYGHLQQASDQTIWTNLLLTRPV